MEKSNNLQERIRKAISDNKINLALELLSDLYKNHSDENIVIQLNGQNRKLQDDKFLGIVSRQDEDIEINKIRNSILDLVDRFQTGDRLDSLNSNSDNNKKIIVGDITATNVYIGDKNYPNNSKSVVNKKLKWYQKPDLILKLIGVFIAIVVLVFGNNLFGRYCEDAKHAKNGDVVQNAAFNGCQLPFPKNDSILNILITKFNSVNDNETKCIGMSIEERINNLKQNKKLRVNVAYCDTIASPTDPDIVKKLRKKFNADLLLYGTADVKETCTDNSKFRFKYTFTDSIRNLSSHQESSNSISSEDCEELFTGELIIDGKKLESWLLPYIALKDKDIDEAIKLFEDIERRQITDITLEEIYSFAALTYLNYHYYSLTKAKKYLYKLVEIDYKNIETRRQLITVSIFENDCSKVIEHSDTLFSITKFLDDELCPIRNDFLQMGLAKANCDKNEEAIEYLTKVIKYEGTNNGYCNTKDIRIFGVSRIDSSRFDSDLVQAYLTRGKSFAKLDRLTKASQDFKKVIELDIGIEKDIEELIEQYELETYFKTTSYINSQTE